MITSTFVNLISKNGFQNAIQTSSAQVSIETGLKAVGRPAFTLADTHVDKETRKYSAVKELLYQVLFLWIYLAVIPLTFTKAGFSIFKKLCNKLDKHPEILKSITKTAKAAGIEKCSLDIFKNSKGLVAIHNFSHINVPERADKNNILARKLLNKIEKNINWDIVKKEYGSKEEFMKKLFNSDRNDIFFRQFFIGKGGIEMTSIVGSVVGLTLLAPELSHLILHPVMKALHMDAPKAAAENKPKNIDKQA